MGTFDAFLPIVFGIAGGFLASSVGLPFGLGFAIGSMMAPRPDVVGPRVGDRTVTTGGLGDAVPRAYGTYEWAGIYLYSTDLRERAHKKKSGGLFGFGGATLVSFSYDVDCMIGFCNGPMGGLLHLEGDNKRILDLNPSALTTSHNVQDFAIYLGTATQDVDPMLLAAKGAAATPAYRDLALVRLTRLVLTDYGNRLPNMMAEWFRTGTGVFDSTTFATTNTTGIWGRYSDGVVVQAQDFGIKLYDAIGRTFFRDVVLTNPDGRPGFDGVTHDIVVDQELTNAISLRGNSNEVPMQSFDLVTGIYDRNIGTDGIFEGDGQFSNGQVPYYGRDSFTTMIQDGSDVRSVTNEYALSVNWDDNLTIKHFSITRITNGLPLLMEVYRTRGDLGWGSGKFSWPAHDGEFAWVGYGDATMVELVKILWSRGESWAADSSPPARTNGVVVQRIDLSGSLQTRVPGNIDDWPLIYDAARSIIVMWQWDGTNGRWLKMDLAGNVIGATILTDDYRSVTFRMTMRSGVPPGGKLYVQKVNQLTIDVLDVDAWTLSEDAHDLTSWGIGSDMDQGMMYFAETDSWLAKDGSTGYWIRLPRVAAGDGTPFNEVVDAEYTFGGELASADLGFDGTDSDIVKGYLVAGFTNARNNVDPLLLTHNADVVEGDLDGTGWKIWLRKRGAAASFAIPENDLGVGIANRSSQNEKLIEKVQNEATLPWKVELGYAHPDSRYEAAFQQDKRADEATQSRKVFEYQTAEVLGHDEAKQIARRILAEAWMQRVSYEFATFPKHLLTHPTDRGTVTKDGVIHTMRLISQELGANWSLVMKGVRDEPSIYTQVGTGVQVIYGEPAILQVRASEMFLVDTGLLDASLETLGFLAWGASRFADPNWPGMALLQSADDGDPWEVIAQFFDQTPHGTTGALVLGDHARWTVFDRTNSFTVNWVGTPPANPSGATLRDRERSVMNGENWFVVGSEADGWEILGAATVVDNGDDTYTFSALLRGRAGTDHKIGGHVEGEMIFPADTSTAQAINIGASSLGVKSYFRADTAGGNASDASRPMTPTAEMKRPITVWAVAGIRSGSDLDLTWRWRSRHRQFPDWMGGYLTDELSEYTANLYDPSGVTVSATQDVTDEAATWTGAQITTAGYADNNDPIVVGIIQKSTVTQIIGIENKLTV